jgi:tetratricopeptide (TPR) repeat protein
MKPLAVLFLAVSLCGPALAHGPAAPDARPVTLLQGYGNLTHPVTTNSPLAQKFFDQGLRLIYSFNHDEATRSFRHAAEIDPKLAMAWWGVAEAVGPNYNDPASDERFMQAHQAIQKAVDLSAGASLNEQGYIRALALRFPASGSADRKQAAEAYRDAMRELARQFPDDLDAATLFAESGMVLHPWGLWHLDGTPQDGTTEIVATLESVIKREPNHMGAVHYYIHAVEASPSPERALAAANRLAALAPAAGHLVHMPAHIYIRTGDYDAAVLTNHKAAAADASYIKASGSQGIYPAMYYSHNLHFIACAASMIGNYPAAKTAAATLVANVKPFLPAIPPLEAFMAIPLAVDVRFHKWNQILATPQPPAAQKLVTTYWSFARGMALAGTGKLSAAEAQYKALAATRDATSPDAIFAMPFNNKTKSVLTIALDVLGAKIALAKKDPVGAIALLRDAVAVQDGLNYGEPPDWFYPVRESLGAALLMNNDASGAEQVFRQDLDRNPRNPRSLFGLHQALKAQGHDYDAAFVEKQFRAAWQGGAVPLKLENLV